MEFDDVLTYISKQKLHQLHAVNAKQHYRKRCSNKECCKQCRNIKFKGTMTKWPVQKLTHKTTQKHLQHQQTFGKNYIFVFFCFLFLFIFFFLYNFLNEFPRNVELSPWYGQ